MFPRVSLLDDAGKQGIHERSLQVMERTGVRFASPKALAVLRDAGCQVDDDTQIARIPRRLVEEAITSAPKTMLLAGRDPGRDVLLDHTRTHATLDGIGAYTLDYTTGERRLSKADDLAQAVRVGDALDEVSVAWYIVNPTDEKPKLEILRGVETMLSSTGKHVQAEVLHPDEVPFVMAMLAAASDDGRWDRERPTFSIVYCPVAPLQHERDSLEAAMLLAKERVPITVFSLALAGATAPVTVAGTIVQTNCDVLSAFVLLQLVEPGCPLIYVGDSAIMDMRSATYATAGPEAVLINLGLSEMGKHYGFPVLTTGFTSDAKELCMQSGLDGGLMAALAHLSGVDLVTGMGMLDSAQMLYLPKLILDAEVMRECQRLMRGVDFDDAHFLTDLIDEVGPGGHYLKARVTTQMLRAGEHWAPTIFTRNSYEAWAAAPASEYDRAVAILENILSTHRPKALPAGAESAISEIIAAADRELPER
jgi:trimethylamine---corrinoid protein Co-methyltransferase